jgi:hypothetical protein
MLLVDPADQEAIPCCPERSTTAYDARGRRQSTGCIGRSRKTDYQTNEKGSAAPNAPTHTSHLAAPSLEGRSTVQSPTAAPNPRPVDIHALDHASSPGYRTTSLVKNTLRFLNVNCGTSCRASVARRGLGFVGSGATTGAHRYRPNHRPLELLWHHGQAGRFTRSYHP